MEPGFKLEGNAIDTAALEDELGRRIEERRRSGAYSHDVEAMLAERLPDEADSAALPPASALDYAATRAMSSWEVTAAYPVATDRRLLRPFILFTKRLARLWARIAVGPIQREQTAYNRHVATALEAVRRQALGERARVLAAEDDLCELAGAMALEPGPAEMARAVTDALAGASRITLLGPCDPGLASALKERGEVTRVSPPTPWDEPGDASSVATGPLTFISQVPEGSLDAVLICDLAFWLRPEALLDLVRRSYLALGGGGRLAVAVRSIEGNPAPAWCSAAVVRKALELAGFTGTEATGPEAGAPAGWFVAAGRKG